MYRSNISLSLESKLVCTPLTVIIDAMIGAANGSFQHDSQSAAHQSAHQR